MSLCGFFEDPPFFFFPSSFRTAYSLQSTANSTLHVCSIVYVYSVQRAVCGGDVFVVSTLCVV